MIILIYIGIVALVLTFISIFLNEIDGFLQRLCLFIHMYGFILGICGFVLGMYIGFNPIEGIPPLAAPLGGIFHVFAFTGLGWVVRYRLIGKCNFFPFL